MERAVTTLASSPPDGQPSRADQPDLYRDANKFWNERFRKVQRLYVDWTAVGYSRLVTDVARAGLGEHRLIELVLRSIDTAGLCAGKWSALRHLTLDTCAIDGLPALTCLRTLRVVRNPTFPGLIYPDLALQLRDALAGANCLEELEISHSTGLARSWRELLVETRWEHLRKLCLTASHLNDSSAIVLADARMPVLQELWLDRLPRVGDTTVCALMQEAPRLFPRLRVLSLARSGVTGRGLVDVAIASRDLRFTYLDVSQIRWNDDIAPHVFGAGEWPCLHTLMVADNGVASLEFLTATPFPALAFLDARQRRPPARRGDQNRGGTPSHRAAAGRYRRRPAAALGCVSPCPVPAPAPHPPMGAVAQRIDV